MTQLEYARNNIVTTQMRKVARLEGLDPVDIKNKVAEGVVVIPANTNRNMPRWCAIGEGLKTKVNANIGMSVKSSNPGLEKRKLKVAIKSGADTVMDLSTGGDLDECREAIIRASAVPIGTVPIYSMIIGRNVEDLTYDDILKEIEKQAKQGVDFFTIHCGILRKHLPHVKTRIAGIVSRGGSLIAQWMNHHQKENPFYTMFDQICEIAREHDVTLSLGDGLRPGCLADATDKAQLAELRTLGELTERAWANCVQVMIEGPGHVPFDQVEVNDLRVCADRLFFKIPGGIQPGRYVFGIALEESDIRLPFTLEAE